MFAYCYCVLADRQAIELFHLQFVRLLCAGPDKDRFAIKGGCNLRFFFESVRYSEDIDLDVARIPVHKLNERVTRILSGSALGTPLRSRGISITDVSAPKQTDTTQRWKVALGVESRSLPLHTKIEFSRRTAREEAEVAPIAASVLADYQLLPMLAPHYGVHAAMRQKVSALAGRSTVQARDVFDLAVLLSRTGGKLERLGGARELVAKATDRAMEISYADYKAQVLSYLKPENAEEYGTRAAWDAMRTQAVDALEKARS